MAAGLALLACAREHSERVPVKEVDAGPSSPSARDIGARAFAKLEPTIRSDEGRGVHGMAMFLQVESAVTVSMMVLNCSRDAKPYDVFVKEGGDCSDATLSGPNWDGARGEGLEQIRCSTTSFGRAYSSRENDAKNAWSIGAPAASDLLGHALVVVDSGSGQTVSCGTITRDEASAMTPPPATVSEEEVENLAPIAGACLAGSYVRTNKQRCPNLRELVECAAENCEVTSCEEVCSDYIACMGRSNEPCMAAVTCPLTEACSQCQMRVVTCMSGFCLEQLACAPPSMRDGPCSQLKACCALQGDESQACVETVELLEKFSGDVSCEGAKRDWDFFAHLQVPCEFQ